MNTVQDTIINRRSYRQLSCQEEISRETIEEVLRVAQFAPSAFNMQSSRVIVLMGSGHKDLWRIVEESLIEKIGEEKMEKTRDKLQGFSDGCGTILFYEDMNIVTELGKKFPSYEEHFKNWSEQGSGILQYAVWLGLTDKNIEASLQHYNPLIDNKVQLAFNLPDHWVLKSQMPFGHGLDELEKRPLNEMTDFVRWE